MVKSAYHTTTQYHPFISRSSNQSLAEITLETKKRWLGFFGVKMNEILARFIFSKDSASTQFY